MNIAFDLDTLLTEGKLTTEIEHERAIVLYRQLRLLEKEHPELAVKRSALRTLIKDYETSQWSDENISDELVAQSDIAERVVEAERQFLMRRKELIRSRLKELSLTQKEFGTILGPFEFNLHV